MQIQEHISCLRLLSTMYSTFHKTLTRKTSLNEKTSTRFPMECQMEGSSNQKEELLVRTSQSLGQND
jgi:hypothetical protein